MDGQRKRILIVDHDDHLLITLERILEDEGFDTTTTWNLKEALKLLNSRDFDLLLLGDHPPEVKCAELMKQLRPRRNKVSCIVLHSAARYPFEAEYLCWVGANALMSRWNHHELVAKIRECLGTTDDAPEEVPARLASAA